MDQACDSRLVVLVNELVRLAHWLGREEPRRHELQDAVRQLESGIRDPGQLGRAVLRCAVTVDRMYSSSLKRLIKAKLVELHRLTPIGPQGPAPSLR